MIDNNNVEDLWDDMDSFNALYVELLWHHKDKLEFTPDYDIYFIIINNVSMNGSKPRAT